MRGWWIKQEYLDDEEVQKGHCFVLYSRVCWETLVAASLWWFTKSFAYSKLVAGGRQSFEGLAFLSCRRFDRALLTRPTGLESSGYKGGIKDKLYTIISGSCMFSTWQRLEGEVTRAARMSLVRIVAEMWTGESDPRPWKNRKWQSETHTPLERRPYQKQKDHMLQRISLRAEYSTGCVHFPRKASLVAQWG